MFNSRSFRFIVLMACIFVGYPSRSQAGASSEDGIDIYLTQGGRDKKLNFSLTTMKSLASQFFIIEPNFMDLGRISYTGIYLSDVLKHFKSSPKNLTFVCNDSYINSLQTSNVAASGTAIAYEMMSRNLALRYGGPFSIINNVLQSKDRYPWYLKAIYFDEPKSPSISIEKSGKVRELHLADFKNDFPKKTIDVIPPIPRGYRDTPILSHPKSLKSNVVSLNSILSRYNLKSGNLTLQSASGAEAKLVYPDETKNAHIIWSMGSRNVPVNQGGPFILVLNDKNKDTVSKSLFFLQKIVVE